MWQTLRFCPHSRELLLLRCAVRIWPLFSLSTLPVVSRFPLLLLRSELSNEASLLGRLSLLSKEVFSIFPWLFSFHVAVARNGFLYIYPALCWSFWISRWMFSNLLNSSLVKYCFWFFFLLVLTLDLCWFFSSYHPWFLKTLSYFPSPYLSMLHSV